MPEAVLDGIEAALNQVQWKPESEKSIIMALDSPPHGKRFGNDDTFTYTGLSEEKLLSKMREMKIDLSIIKLTSYLDQMIKVFSQYINIEIFKSKVFEERNKYSSVEYTEKVSEAFSSNYAGKYNKRFSEL